MIHAMPKQFSNVLVKFVLLSTLVVGLALTPLAWGSDEDIAEGSARAAIREANYPCAHVISMDRSTEQVEAAEGFTVWTVQCNSGSFKVTFKGDAGSEVVPLD